MGVIRHKIWKDLWSNKARTLQVVLIISMGAFAIGMIITTRNLVIQGMDDIWASSSPASIGMWAGPSVDDDTIANFRRIDGVEDVEGYAESTAEWRLGDEDEWRPAAVLARRDYVNQKYAKLDLESGAWPTKNTAVTGQGADVVYGVYAGETITLRVDGHERTFTISGTAYDPNAQPPSFGGNAQFFLTQTDFENLFAVSGYNRILAGMETFNETEAIAIADTIDDKLERQDVQSGGMMPPNGGRVVSPDKHFFQDVMDGIFFVLGVMAILALGLGLFLVYNTINAIIMQQTDQIGVMKAIGASSWQILAIFLLYVFCFGLLSLIIAVPLGALGGWGLNVFLLNSFNAEPGPFTISWVAVGAQLILAIVAPMLVALIPVIAGARITVREAVSSYGLSTHTTLLDRLIAKLKKVSRLVLLTVSNTFRHKWRVGLTQITLVLSGLIFMMVMSVGDSTNYTFNDLLFSILNSNINLGLEDSERISRVEALTMQHPDVKAVEMWSISGGSGRPYQNEASDDDPGVTVFGVPAETSLYGYQLRDGRWLNEADTYSVVLNQEVAQRMGVGVGDTVTLDLNSTKEVDWHVVGLLFDPLISDSAHVPREVLLHERVSVGRTNTVWVQINDESPANEERVAADLREMYTTNGIDVSPGGILAGQDTSSKIVDIFNTQFRAIITLLAVMALVIGIVGSISLSGVLSLNVIERQREIGVMRAIGAPTWDITRLFVGEGLILGWMSWIIALPFSLVAGRLMTTALSTALDTEIVYHYTPQGALYWLAIITILSILASGLPARKATRVSVRQSLAYL